jgi:hypothetical protein
VERPRRSRHGKLLGLLRSLREHGEAIEADLARFYGERLSELGGALSWRRASALVRSLPPDSAFARSCHGSAAVDYSPTVAAIAGASYRLELLLWQNSGGKGPQPRPPQPPESAASGAVASSLKGAELDSAILEE